MNIWNPDERIRLTIAGWPIATSGGVEMLQMIAVMIYGGALALALAVLAAGLADHRAEIALALFGRTTPAAPRARFVARARRVRSLKIRPRTAEEQRRAA